MSREAAGSGVVRETSVYSAPSGKTSSALNFNVEPMQGGFAVEGAALSRRFFTTGFLLCADHHPVCGVARRGGVTSLFDV